MRSRLTLLGRCLLPMLTASRGELKQTEEPQCPTVENADWLALTEEETLEPEILISDPHHHFWDFRSERIPYQRYLLHELAADVNCGHNVRSTVFIEARSMYRPTGRWSCAPLARSNLFRAWPPLPLPGSMGLAGLHQPSSDMPT